MSAHVARKRFGQHFLVDQGVIAAIVRAIAPQADDAMVEIGPGQAALTAPLLEHLRHLHAVELDRDLAPRLSQRFGTRISVHAADALQFDFGTLCSAGRPLRVAGNLPYNISSPLLFHLMRWAGSIADQHFMLQKEVVDRMAAQPGDSDYGRLSVMLQARYYMESLFDVPPDAFDPPPKVMSAVLRMIPLPPAQVLVNDWDAFGKVVAQAFSQRRKMLRNTMAAHRDGMEAVGIAPTLRAEDVTVQQYAALAQQIHAEK
jgi:16S rRNA (adenine1518-N6/adenine1519-N6)-dimethyltransferase